MPKPEIVTHQGNPVSVNIERAGGVALKRGMEKKSREFVEKGAEVYAKA